MAPLISTSTVIKFGTICFLLKLFIFAFSAKTATVPDPGRFSFGSPAVQARAFRRKIYSDRSIPDGKKDDS